MLRSSDFAVCDRQRHYDPLLTPALRGKLNSMRLLLYALAVPLILLFSVSAQPPPAPAPHPTPVMSKEDSWHGKAIAAQLNMLQVQWNALQASAQQLGQEQNALKEKVCAEAKISVEKCNPDFAAGTIAEVKPVPPAAPAPPEKPPAAPEKPPATK
jgi:hypothetical protein